MRSSRHQLDSDAALILGSAIHFLLADGRIDNREIAILRDLATRLGAEVAMNMPDWRNLADDYGQVTTSDPDVARHCLAECFVMMAADDEIHDAERRAWIQLAVWLGATAAESRTALKNLESRFAGPTSHAARGHDSIVRQLKIALPSFERSQ